jgi:ABC-type multidrug transport system ATPase subunit
MSASVIDFESVQVEDVSRRFGRRRALSHVSVTAHAGDVIALLGPNGAGKSTLLAILSTLLSVSAGRVCYGTRTAAEPGDDLRAQIGLLGHDMFLYGDLTARENLTFFATLYGLDQVASRVDAALDYARLRDRGDDRVAGFSRGMRQRLALERALIHTPTLVLLDEPFTGLDEESAGVLAQRLDALRLSGAIIIMATHDFEYADRVATRAVCLSDGRVQPIEAGGGTLRDRYRRTLQAGRS